MGGICSSVTICSKNCHLLFALKKGEDILHLISKIKGNGTVGRKWLSFANWFQEMQTGGCFDRLQSELDTKGDPSYQGLEGLDGLFRGSDRIDMIPDLGLYWSGITKSLNIKRNRTWVRSEGLCNLQTFPTVGSLSSFCSKIRKDPRNLGVDSFLSVLVLEF